MAKNVQSILKDNGDIKLIINSDVEVAKKLILLEFNYLLKIFLKIKEMILKE